MINIRVMTNSIVVKTSNPIMISYLNGIKKNYVKFEKRKIKTKFGFKEIVEEGNTFIGGNQLLNEFVLLKTLLPSIVSYIRLQGFNDTMTVTNPKPITKDIDVTTIGYKDKPYQSKYIDKLKDAQGVKLVHLQTGKGKALKHTTLIRMVTTNKSLYWKMIGDIEIGDKVLTPEGGIARVTGVYPQGHIDLYTITFKDNRKLECSIDHLWEVTVNNDTMVLSTKDIMELLDNNETVSIKPPVVSDDYISKDKIDYFANFLDKYAVSNDKDMGVVHIPETVMAKEFNKLTKTLFYLGLTYETIGSRGDMTIVHILYSSPIYITSIKESTSGYATCIKIDSKKALYIAEGYIPTHNTYIAARVIEERSKRTTIVIKPEYFSKWIGDLKGLYVDLKDEDVLVVSGRDKLTKLMLLKPDDIPKFVIISIRTLSLYYKEYENIIDYDMFDYPTRPYDLFDSIRTDVLLVDETHEEFYCVYLTFLYANCSLFLGLSATLVSGDRRMTKFHEDVYAKNNRLDYLAFDKYVEMHNVSYDPPVPNIKYVSNGGYGYSQSTYESNIIKNPLMLEWYLRMLCSLTVKYYTKDCVKVDKLIIFCGTVKMCTVVRDRLRKEFKDKTIERYVSVDPYKNVIEPDIRVTTIKSAGRAIDIPGLTVVINTMATNSQADNLQLVGRLRDIPGRTVKSIMVWSNKIRQHNTYKRTLISLYMSRAKKILTELYS